MAKQTRLISGFTIVELLIVVVVIAILAAIVIVGYRGITQRAIVASLQTDLSTASTKLNLYRAEHNQYPASLDTSNCPAPADENYCLKASADTSLVYVLSSPWQAYTLWATRNDTSYVVTNDSSPVAVTATPLDSLGVAVGSRLAGATLTAGALSPSGATATYQWQSAVTAGGAYSDIAGATNANYTLTSGELNKYIRLVATGTSGYGGAVISAEIGPITSSAQIQALVVAGGGGGGSGGGGGGGGLIANSSSSVTLGSYSVTIGGGGAGGNPGNGANGGNSIFNGMTAIGGGGGGGHSTVALAGSNGGSGGGGGLSINGTDGANGGTGVAGQGNAGGIGLAYTCSPSGGGGGAGAVGGAGTTAKAGDGGAGVASSITGSSVYYAGGGGGGAWCLPSGAGGSGGGGNGNGTTGVAGTPNTGGGGGGGAANGGSGGAAGGSGVVIISYPTGVLKATGGTITTSGGNTIHKFTASGTFVVQ